MRSLKLVTILLAVAPVPARAQDTPPQSAFDPMLRAYSKVIAVIEECRRAYPVNVPRAKAYASAFLEVAQKAGAQKADLEAEYDRRATEVRITGARPWCMTARAGLRKLALQSCFPSIETAQFPFSYPDWKSSMRLMLAAGLSLIITGCAWADNLRMGIFDILHRPEYHTAYDRMVRGQRGLPAWMSSAKAAMGGAGQFGVTQTVEGRPRELFTFHEAHNAGRYFAVMFVPYKGVPRKGALSTGEIITGHPSERPIRYFGDPDDQEKLALKAVLDTN